MMTPRKNAGPTASHPSAPPPPPSPSATGRRALALSNDLVFKTLFSRQPHLLTDLINAVRYRYPPIQVVQIRNPNILPADVSSKQIILDILAKDACGSFFNVEMQLRHYPQWPQRNLFYLARMLSDQFDTGQEYQALKPAVSISLLGHDLYPDYPAQADWHFTLRDSQRPAVQLQPGLGQAMQVHIIELTKAETLHAFPPALSAWIACLRHNLEEDRMNQIEHPPVREAIQHLEDMYSERDLRLIAVRREMAVADYWLGLEDARQTGQREGLRTMLERQLMRKFGSVTPASQQQLAQASVAQMEQWSEQLLDANTQEAVFR